MLHFCHYKFSWSSILCKIMLNDKDILQMVCFKDLGIHMHKLRFGKLSVRLQFLKHCGLLIMFNYKPIFFLDIFNLNVLQNFLFCFVIPGPSFSNQNSLFFHLPLFRIVVINLFKKRVE